jgi:hypothetical protein
MTDIRVENYGSLWLVRPLNASAERWLVENVQEDAHWFGGAVVVEPRYVEALVSGLVEDGFVVA